MSEEDKSHFKEFMTASLFLLAGWLFTVLIDAKTDLQQQIKILNDEVKELTKDNEKNKADINKVKRDLEYMFKTKQDKENR